MRIWDLRKFVYPSTVSYSYVKFTYIPRQVDITLQLYRFSKSYWDSALKLCRNSDLGLRQNFDFNESKFDCFAIVVSKHDQ